MLAPLLALTLLATPALPNVPVERVDLSRYVGTWYEIASLPQRFQKGCTATRATYALREDGQLSIVNECRKDRVDGELRRATGKAWATDASNARLEVQFVWPFHGPYWVIELGRDYEYAVVGHPEHRTLWVLSRTPHMDEALYRGIVERARARGYDVSRLQRTPQP